MREQLPRKRADEAPAHELLHADVTAAVIGAFYRVYNVLGYGFLEAVYANALSLEIANVGLHVQREVPVRVMYEGVSVGAYRADMIVNGSVIVELKATQALCPTDEAQLLNYLRGTSIDVGLLLHFGPRPSFRRLVCTREPSVHRNGPR
jgi:GxxExxY protein